MEVVAVAVEGIGNARYFLLVKTDMQQMSSI